MVKVTDSPAAVSTDCGCCVMERGILTVTVTALVLTVAPLLSVTVHLTCMPFQLSLEVAETVAEDLPSHLVQTEAPTFLWYH